MDNSTAPNFAAVGSQEGGRATGLMPMTGLFTDRPCLTVAVTLIYNQHVGRGSARALLSALAHNTNVLTV